MIVGIGGRDFGNEGSFEPLVGALNKAVTGTRDGAIDLRIVREGSSSPRRVTVTLEELEKAAGKPTSEDGRALLGAGALAWLAERQLDDGGYPQTLSGRNGAVCATSVAGLAWLAGGSSLEEGPHAENVAAARSFVESFVAEPTSGFGGSPGEANWDQTNWGLAHAAIFLGELHDAHARPQRAPRDVALLRRSGSLETPGGESGGWAHGPGGPNALGYVELNIVSGSRARPVSASRMQSGFSRSPDDALEPRRRTYLDRELAAATAASATRTKRRPARARATSAARPRSWLGYLNFGARQAPPIGKKLGWRTPSSATSGTRCWAATRA